MKKYLILLVIPLFSCINGSSQKLLARDYRIFRGTKAWELAKAIDNNDVAAIKEILAKDKKLTTVVDTMYGQTLLGLAVINMKYNAVQALLESGADPNAFNDYDGFTPLMKAIKNGGKVMPNDRRYLDILLKYHADPNLPSKKINKGIYHHYNPLRPLQEAVSAGNVEYVEILVAAGGDLYFNPSSLMYSAMLSREPDMVLYLLNKGFDPKKPMFLNSDPNYPTSIAEELREWTFDLGSEAYKKKMQIVDLLKKQGIDYRNTKIPNDVALTHDRNYLEKY
ncbi:MAG: ankyrin repeat domain-containing protein [Bacteroidetes bacterium]|nr:ankyrin repeat domain-containing protein [Bacteroidota bacterium]